VGKTLFLIIPSTASVLEKYSSVYLVVLCNFCCFLKRMCVFGLALTRIDFDIIEFDKNDFGQQ